jgi:hypothetical protein
MHISDQHVEEVLEVTHIQRISIRYREEENLDSVTMVIEVEAHMDGYISNIDPNSIKRCGLPLSMSAEPGISVESSVEATLSKLRMHLSHYSDEPKPLLTND